MPHVSSPSSLQIVNATVHPDAHVPTPLRPRRRSKQRVDALSTLILASPLIKRDAETYENLRKTARRNITKRAGRGPLKKPATLYSRFRGPLFPLRTATGARVLAWRHLTDWLKAQTASLCIQSGPCKAFTIKLHDELLNELQEAGTDLKVYLRDRLTRCLRDAFGCVPWFMFVIENRTKSGLSHTRPHVHGMISILPGELRELRRGGYSMADQILIKQGGMGAAKIRAGERLTWQAILLASGNADQTRPQVYAGRNQSRNVWWRRPYHALWSPSWISYAFKNVFLPSEAISDDRLVMSQKLTTEARMLWNLIRGGEPMIAQWA